MYWGTMWPAPATVVNVRPPSYSVTWPPTCTGTTDREDRASLEGGSSVSLLPSCTAREGAVGPAGHAPPLGGQKPNIHVTVC